jgi:hypothetical protein
MSCALAQEAERRRLLILQLAGNHQRRSAESLQVGWCNRGRRQVAVKDADGQREAC